MDAERSDAPAVTLGSGADRRRVLRGLLGAAGAASLAGAPGRATPAAAKPATTLFADDFRGGFDATGGDWAYFEFPGFVADDGTETTSAAGLRVRARRFTKTVPQETGPDSLAGGLDHVKWLVFADRTTAAGLPGFAAPEGRELAVAATLSARTFGTKHHPFGGAVEDPGRDLRLACCALNGFDVASWMVFDLLLTNERIFAVYERLPFGRGPGGLGAYASFTFQVPVAERRPGDEHELGIAYDRSAGTVRWLVGGEERFRVDRIGRLVDRKYMTIDHGGAEEDVAPAQLGFGMGMFTLLDGRLPSGEALVRLSTAPDFYFDPAAGEPVPQAFVDEESRRRSRLFGQGAELRVRRYVVESRPPSGRAG